VMFAFTMLMRPPSERHHATSAPDNSGYHTQRGFAVKHRRVHAYSAA
jgi:hypothetical protein